ncbi:hypothetical protein [Sporosarcina cyprini]|uniref:hypothetical protein n=1 Tax=Sporosarcina cyprini TaxID=2910523 RepID=UPI001EDD49AD|nr:hypothetical protein [Sporosarcina cyprini]MCG3089306.1 hypothetical protein [Sporosarcina cyprini]
MKSFFKHPIIAGVVVVIIGFIITPIIAPVKLQSFYEAIKTIGLFIKKILSYGVPVWIIIIIGIAYLFLLKMVKSFSAKIEPDFTSYTSDVLDDIHWEWAWFKSIYKEGYDFKGDTPVPICKRCQGYLVIGSRGYNISFLECENCGFSKSLENLVFKEYQDKIKKEIYRKVRTGQWKADPR